MAYDPTPSKFSSYIVNPPPDNTWGNPQEDGTVTGMIGMAARQDAHFSIDEITITGNLCNL